MTHIKPFQIRAYAREGITRIPLDVQKHYIQKLADELGLKIEWYIGLANKKKSINEERDLWAKQLRCDELGVIHSLPVLRLTGKQLGSNINPKADFSGFVSSIGGLNVIEAATRIERKHKVKWRNAVAEVASKPPPGSNTMTRAEASKLAKSGWETRRRGVVVTWKSEAREVERKHLIRHWKAASSARMAHETLPEFIADMGGGVYEELNGISAKTLERICDTKRNT